MELFIFIQSMFLPLVILLGSWIRLEAVHFADRQAF
jgi:hypothetical protein